jgi:hypothetical protein
MKINRKIEKMFIDEQEKFNKEIENIFYQKDCNTLEYYELDNCLETLEACITNAFACEFYLSHAYKYMREYLRINNSLSILGAVKDEPQIVISIELLRGLNISINDLKIALTSYHIFLNQSYTYKPSNTHNQTLNSTVHYANVNKNPKTSESMFELIVKSIYHAELCFEAIDHLVNYFFDKYETSLNDFDDFELTDTIKKIHPSLLDNYLEFKMSHFLTICL